MTAAIKAGQKSRRSGPISVKRKRVLWVVKRISTGTKTSTVPGKIRIGFSSLRNIAKASEVAVL
jgi:hypothetical protein